MAAARTRLFATITEDTILRGMRSDTSGEPILANPLRTSRELRRLFMVVWIVRFRLVTSNRFDKVWDQKLAQNCKILHEWAAELRKPARELAATRDKLFPGDWIRSQRAAVLPLERTSNHSLP